MCVCSGAGGFASGRAEATLHPGAKYPLETGRGCYLHQYVQLGMAGTLLFQHARREGGGEWWPLSQWEDLPGGGQSANAGLHPFHCMPIRLFNLPIKATWVSCDTLPGTCMNAK